MEEPLTDINLFSMISIFKIMINLKTYQISNIPLTTEILETYINSWIHLFILVVGGVSVSVCCITVLNKGKLKTE